MYHHLHWSLTSGISQSCTRKPTRPTQSWALLSCGKISDAVRKCYKRGESPKYQYPILLISERGGTGHGCAHTFRAESHKTGTSHWKAEPSSRKARSHRSSTSVPSKWETLQNPMKTAMKSVLWKPCTFCGVTAVRSHHPPHQRTLWVRSCFHRNKWDFFFFFFTQKQQERILWVLHSALLRGAFLRSAWKKVRKISMEDKNSKPTWKRTGKQKQFSIKLPACLGTLQTS